MNDTPPKFRRYRKHSGKLDDLLKRCERRAIKLWLRKYEGHVSKVAAVAGRNRTQFYKTLKYHNIIPAEFRRKKGDAT